MSDRRLYISNFLCWTSSCKLTMNSQAGHLLVPMFRFCYSNQFLCTIFTFLSHIRAILCPIPITLTAQRKNAGGGTNKPLTDERYLGRCGSGDERKYLARAFIPTNYIHSTSQCKAVYRHGPRFLFGHDSQCTQSSIYFFSCCSWACDYLVYNFPSCRAPD